MKQQAQDDRAWIDNRRPHDPAVRDPYACFRLLAALIACHAVPRGVAAALRAGDSRCVLRLCGAKNPWSSPLLAFGEPKPQPGTSSRLEVKRMEQLDINEVAHRSGIPASTLRFYEAKGLTASIVVGAR